MLIFPSLVPSPASAATRRLLRDLAGYWAARDGGWAVDIVGPRLENVNRPIIEVKGISLRMVTG